MSALLEDYRNIYRNKCCDKSPAPDCAEVDILGEGNIDISHTNANPNYKILELHTSFPTLTSSMPYLLDDYIATVVR